jgi:hypothetical protein
MEHRPVTNAVQPVGSGAFKMACISSTVRCLTNRVSALLT